MTSQTEFDSEEEEMFWDWCIEAQQADIIESFEYQPCTFDIFPKLNYILPVQLKTKIRHDLKALLMPMVYTPDFKITGKDLSKFHKHRKNPFIESGGIITDSPAEYYIDIKGTFAKNGGHDKFSIVQKALWNSNGIYVNKITPCKFFEYAWLPERTCECADLIWKNNGDRRAPFKDCKTLKELENA